MEADWTSYSQKISITGSDFVCVFVVVTLSPAGQIPKQQSEHFKQEVVGHSQELRVEGQGNDVLAELFGSDILNLTFYFENFIFWRNMLGCSFSILMSIVLEQFYSYALKCSKYPFNG